MYIIDIFNNFITSISTSTYTFVLYIQHTIG